MGKQLDRRKVQAAREAYLGGAYEPDGSKALAFMAGYRAGFKDATEEKLMQEKLKAETAIPLGPPDDYKGQPPTPLTAAERAKADTAASGRKH
jgi:hypothetical protein